MSSNPEAETRSDGEQPPDRTSGTLQAGDVLLGHYRVDHLLGEGGMGAVYLAHDTDLGKPVVIKVPHAELMLRGHTVERFEREIQGLLELEHPHVVRILARGRWQQLPFLVQQFLGGGSLRERLDALPDRRQPPEVVARWLVKVAEALDFVHARGYVHRDIKPGNILFDEHDLAYVADLGLAKAVNSDSTELTRPGTSPGTPAYMAPEQFLAEDYDGRVDQYALAVTALEALTGRLPFAARNLHGLLAEKQAERAPTGLGDLPAGSEEAILRSLAADPARRYDSCKQLAVAFVRCMRGSRAVTDSRGTGSSGATVPSASAPTRMADGSGSEAPTLAPPTAPTVVPAPRPASVGGGRNQASGVRAPVTVPKDAGTTPRDPGNRQPSGSRARGSAAAAPPEPSAPTVRNATWPRPAGGAAKLPLALAVLGAVAILVVLGAALSNLWSGGDERPPGAPTPAAPGAVADTTPPQVTIEQPATDRRTDQAVATVMVSCGEDISEVLVLGHRAQLDGRRAQLDVPLRHGENVLHVVARDLAGNLGRAEVVVDCDLTPPQLLISRPRDGIELDAGAESIEVAGSIDDPKATLVVGGRTVAFQGRDFSEIVPLASGEQQIEVTATDLFGRQATASVRIRRLPPVTAAAPAPAPSVTQDDPAPPHIELLQPVGDAPTDQASILVSGVAGSSAVAVRIDGRLVPLEPPVAGSAAAEKPGTRSFAQQVSLKHGKNDLVIEAEDAGGKVSHLQVSVVADLHPPVLELEGDGKLVLASAEAPAILRGRLDDPADQLTVGDRAIVVGSDGTFAVELTAAERAAAPLVVRASDGWKRATVRQVWITTLTPDTHSPEVKDFTFLGFEEVGVDGAIQSVAVYRFEPFARALELEEGETAPECEFILIPAGSYVRGSPEEERDRQEDEEQRTVQVPAFLLARTEVTWELGVALAPPAMAAGLDDSTGDRTPVDSVTWKEASLWTSTLGLRLPTEAEWEYACRAGTDSPYGFAGGAAKLAQYAWYERTAKGRSHPVAEKLANGFGLHDMHGNVMEWCEDIYDDYAATPTDGSAHQLATSKERVQRGGSWASPAADLRSACRDFDDQDSSFGDVGVRAARSLPR